PSAGIVVFIERCQAPVERAPSWRAGKLSMCAQLKATFRSVEGRAACRLRDIWFCCRMQLWESISASLKTHALCAEIDLLYFFPGEKDYGNRAFITRQ